VRLPGIACAPQRGSPLAAHGNAMGIGL
jgi:hypothetical protein